jgi:hypothetical protein
LLDSLDYVQPMTTSPDGRSTTIQQLGPVGAATQAERLTLSTLLGKVRARLSPHTQATADEEAGA